MTLDKSLLTPKFPPLTFGNLSILFCNSLCISLTLYPALSNILGINPCGCPTNASNKCSTLYSPFEHFLAKFCPSDKANVAFSVYLLSI